MNNSNDAEPSPPHKDKGISSVKEEEKSNLENEKKKKEVQPFLRVT